MTLSNRVVITLVLFSVLLAPAQFAPVQTANAQTGQEWQTPTGTSNNITAIGGEPGTDTIYAGTTGGDIVAFDRSDGSVVWSTTTSTGNEITDIEVDRSNGVVYTVETGSGSQLRQFDATTGTELDTATPANNFVFTVDINRQTSDVYIGSNDAIEAFDSNLNPLWTDTGRSRGVAYVNSSYSVFGSGGSSTNARGLDSSGNQIWTLTPFAGSSGDADSIGDFAYVTISNNGLYRVNEDGTSRNQVVAGDSGALDVDQINNYVFYNDGSLIQVYDTTNSQITSFNLNTGGGQGLFVDSESSRTTQLYYPNSDSLVKYDTGIESTESVLSGEVRDDNGDPVPSATITIRDTAGNTVASTTTDQVGQYSIGLTSGDYFVEATKTDYTIDNQSIQFSGGQTVDFQIEPLGNNIRIQVRNHIEHGQQSDYRVVVENETGVYNVSSAAIVTSNNTSVVTIDSTNLRVIATSNVDVNQRTYIEANYTDSTGDSYVATENVTVANETVDNIQILPPWSRVASSINDETIQVILVATMFGAVVGFLSRSFAGLATMTLVMTLGWLGGYVGNGMVVVSVLIALFIGLNTAANIDYTVQR